MSVALGRVKRNPEARMQSGVHESAHLLVIATNDYESYQNCEMFLNVFCSFRVILQKENLVKEKLSFMFFMVFWGPFCFFGL